MAQMVRGDTARLPAETTQAGVSGGAIEAVAETEWGKAPSPLHEQEVDRLAVARMRQGPLDAAQRHPGIEGGEGLRVEGNGALGPKLSERDLDPGAVGGEVPQAVELEIQQLADAHAGSPQDEQSVAGKGVVERGHRRHDVAVSIRG